MNAYDKISCQTLPGPLVVSFNPSSTVTMEAAMAPEGQLLHQELRNLLLLAKHREHFSGKTTIEEPVPSRDHTERMLELMGVELNRSGTQISLPPVALLAPASIRVPGDFSSAAFWIVAALICPGSRVQFSGVGVNPTRTGLLNILRAMGATVLVNAQSAGAEPMADLEIAAQELS
ncbi:MAG: hypothetical protein HYU64_11145 [Armatimonadetes bacterium]|nr:hypothetical protein [Armatimonadota bacterium]